MNPNRLSLSSSSTPAIRTPRSEVSIDDLTGDLVSLKINMPFEDNSDSLQQLIAALTASNRDRASSAKPIRWPEWDGLKDSYSLFKWTLQSKIEQEMGQLGSHKAICTNIFAGLPKDKQQRVIYWLQEGGENKDWEPKEFLKHMDDKFLDREQERKSLDKLDQLRQGDKQRFEDFRQQFELLVAQAGSLAPKDASKVNTMRRALNPSLSKYLISVTLSNTDYDAYVAGIQPISTNFEAHPEFRKSTGSSKHYYQSSQRSNTDKRPASPQAPEKDPDGDVIMTDVNALAVKIAAILAQTGSSSEQKKDKRPRAKWRSTDEFSNLIKSGKCGRCKEKRHANLSQCKYRPAARPKTQVSAVNTPTEIPASEGESESNSESENE